MKVPKSIADFYYCQSDHNCPLSELPPLYPMDQVDAENNHEFDPHGIESEEKDDDDL